jgi:hypothetical protein
MRNTLSILLLVGVRGSAHYNDDDYVPCGRGQLEDGYNCDVKIEMCDLRAEDSCCEIPDSYCDVSPDSVAYLYDDDQHYNYGDGYCAHHDQRNICDDSSGASNAPTSHHDTPTGGCAEEGCPKESAVWKKGCAETGCPLHWLKDTVCDDACKNIECKFDGGDCLSPSDTHHTYANHPETEQTWARLDVNHDGVIKVGEGGSKITKQLISKIESLDGDNSNDNGELTKMEVDHAFQVDFQDAPYDDGCPYDDDFYIDGCRWSAAAMIRAVALHGLEDKHGRVRDGELPDKCIHTADPPHCYELSSSLTNKAESESASLHSIQHDQHDQQWKLVGSLCGSGLVVLAAAIVVIVHRRKAIAASAPAIKSISLTPPTSLI